MSTAWIPWAPTRWASLHHFERVPASFLLRGCCRTEHTWGDAGRQRPAVGAHECVLQRGQRRCSPFHTPRCNNSPLPLGPLLISQQSDQKSPCDRSVCIGSLGLLSWVAKACGSAFTNSAVSPTAPQSTNCPSVPDNCMHAQDGMCLARCSWTWCGACGPFPVVS